MYVTTISVSPKIGNEVEAREILQGWVRHRQSQGMRVDLTASMFSPDGPALVAAHLYDDLAALEAQWRADRADPDYQARTTRLVPLVRGPSITRLFENLVSGAGRGSAPVLYRGSVVHYPTVGNEGQAVEVLTQWVKGRQAEGRTRRSLWRELFSPAGSALVMVELFLDLAEFERVWRETTPVSEKATAALTGLSRAPSQALLAEILVPMPS